jgi:ATP-dependent Clp protease protease subunit
MSSKIVNLVGEVNDDMYSKLLRSIGRNSDSVTLYINTSGGDEYLALAMFDLIKAHPHKIIGVVNGRCNSAGVLILLACDHRVCTENSSFLFHLGSGEYGNPEDLKQVLFIDRKWNALVAEATGQPLVKTIKWHRSETYMDARLALKNKVVQQIIPRATK